MPLLFHPDGGKLLLAPSGDLAGDTNCCCCEQLCDCVAAAVEIEVVLSGITSGTCVACTESNGSHLITAGFFPILEGCGQLQGSVAPTISSNCGRGGWAVDALVSITCIDGVASVGVSAALRHGGILGGTVAVQFGTSGGEELLAQLCAGEIIELPPSLDNSDLCSNPAPSVATVQLFY